MINSIKHIIIWTEHTSKIFNNTEKAEKYYSELLIQGIEAKWEIVKNPFYQRIN